MVAPTKPSTPLEWRIVFWILTGLMLLMGILGIGLSFLDVTDKLEQQEIRQLRQLSGLFLLLGSGLAFFLWNSRDQTG